MLRFIVGIDPPIPINGLSLIKNHDKTKYVSWMTNCTIKPKMLLRLHFQKQLKPLNVKSELGFCLLNFSDNFSECTYPYCALFRKTEESIFRNVGRQAGQQRAALVVDIPTKQASQQVLEDVHTRRRRCSAVAVALHYLVCCGGRRQYDRPEERERGASRFVINNLSHFFRVIFVLQYHSSKLFPAGVSMALHRIRCENQGGGTFQTVLSVF